jgi:peptidoglycan-associated lipoprotein
MNHFSQKFYFATATAALALLLAGCPQKPTRPDPSKTMLGMQGGPGTGIDQTQRPVDRDFGTGGLLQQPPIDPSQELRAMLAAQTVYFDLDRSDIKAAEREKLKAVKKHLDENPGHRVLLEGYCDWRGTAEYNLALGERRAASVKKYLVSLGVPADKIDTLSKGSLEAQKNADDATMAKDRCVKPVVLDPSRSAAPAPAPKAS